MIKKLRFKFVLVNMSIATLLLAVILGLVFYFTRASLEAESIRMMQGIAAGELAATGGGYYDLSDGAFLRDLVDTVFASPKRLGVIEEYGLRYYRSDLPVSQCLVFSDMSSEKATLESLTRTCILIGGLGFLLFLGVSILLSRWAVRPVERAWKQQRQFVADASHELKTPLTVIMTSAELAQSPDYGREERQRFLAAILTMSRQMKGLIEEMLQLARADQADTQAAFAPVALSRLVSDALLPFEPVFFEAGLALEADVAEDIQVSGSAAQLRQVVEILLDNARKYSRAGGSTQVSLSRPRRGRCLLTVANQGEPLSDQALQNIFKRFYRADPARSRTGSFGLGLAIAETIVTRHHGRIWAESREGRNLFHVELPCG